MASYTLHIQYVDRPAETRTITQPKLIIGRDAGDIVLHDSQVSGRHAEITWDGTTLRFTDLGSTNGSFLLQGQRVANLDLTPGIALRVGNSLITVQSIDGVASGAGKGRTMIAAPGMVPGFPAPMKSPAPPRPPGPLAPPAPPAPGSFAFAPTAQQPGPLLRPAPQSGGAPPGGLAFTPAPPQPAPMPGGFAPAPPQPMPAPMAPAPMAAPMPPGPAPMPPGPAPMPPGPAPMAAAPAPFPAPQPPGPPPGTLSGAGAPAPAPTPVPAAPPVASEPVLMPEVAAPVAPATPPTATAGGAEAGDLGAQIKQILGGGWAVLQPVAAPAIATVAAVMIPIGLLGQLGLMILPFSLASLLATLLALVQLAAMVILFPSVARFILGSYLGQPVAIQTAVQQSINKAADVAVNCFVPCIPLGIFAAPIYYVEDKKLGAVIGRNFNLLGKEVVPIVVSILAGGFALGIGMGIVGYILGLLPFGGIINSIFINGVSAFMVAYGAALSVSLYFSIRRKHEGGDPEGEARARLGAASGALPAA